MLVSTGDGSLFRLMALFVPVRHALAFQYTVTSVTLTKTVAITVFPNPASGHAPAASTSTANPNMSNPSAFASAVLNSTNYYREQHQVEPVKWNTTLADYAENYAKGCIWQHSGGPYGENLAAGYPNTTLAIDGWGDEEKDYNYAKQKFGETVGHFTQLVWSNTTSVGCGLVDCANTAKGGVQGQYLVCEYYPRGNVLGQFGDNVRKPGMAADGTPGMAGAGRVRNLNCFGAALVAVSLLVTIVS